MYLTPIHESHLETKCSNILDMIGAVNLCSNSRKLLLHLIANTFQEGHLPDHLKNKFYYKWSNIRRWDFYLAVGDHSTSQSKNMSKLLSNVLLLQRVPQSLQLKFEITNYLDLFGKGCQVISTRKPLTTNTLKSINMSVSYIKKTKLSMLVNHQL